MRFTVNGITTEIDFDFELWLVLLTLALAIATFMLWWATRALVKGSQDTAKKQLRAYLTVKSIDVTPIVENEHPGFKVVVKNVGATPAHHVSARWGIRFTDVPNLAPAEYSAPLEPRGSTGPDQQITMELDASVPAHRGLIDGIAQRKGGILYYGEVRYQDIFGEVHFTTFKYVHGGQAGPTAGVTWRAPDGNDET